MFQHKLKIAAPALAATLILTGCVTPGEDDPNAATKQGAAGGALLGLTLGALTGEPELAVAGAVAGGVAGGVSGAAVDIDNNRQNMRDANRDDAIAAIGNGNNASAAPVEQAAPQNWDELNHFIGNWDVSVWNAATQETQSYRSSANGALVSTSQAKITLEADQEASSDKLVAQFAFDAEQGYQLNVTNKQTGAVTEYAGEYQAAMNRYNYYPTSTTMGEEAPFALGDIRVQLGFAGNNVWMVDTFAYVDGQEKKIQSFRFNRVM